MIQAPTLAPVSQPTAPQPADNPPTGLALAINTFAGDLCQVYSSKRSLAHKNFVFFTPALISVFSLIYSTSPDSLKTVIEKAMHMGDLRGQIWHPHVRNWLMTLCKVNDLYEMVQKNMVLTQREMTPRILAEFEQQQVQYTIFSNPEQAIADANHWVKAVTQGKIPSLLQDVPSNDLAFILTSAALFNGQWVQPFNIKDTEDRPFHNSNGTVVNVSTMHIKEDLKRAFINNVCVVEKRYKGDISMYFISPQEDSLAEAVLKLKEFMTPNVLNEFMAKRHVWMTSCKDLNLYVPFVAFKDRSNVLEDLKGTDLVRAIEDSDFRSAFPNPIGPRVRMPLIQSEVHLQVDEKGTSIAQAMSAVAFQESVCRKVEELHLNKPFGLLMVDHSSQAILCMGQVYQMESIRRIQPSSVREPINFTCAHVYRKLAEKNLLENRNFSFAMPWLMHALGLIFQGVKETVRPMLKELCHFPEQPDLKWHGDLAKNIGITLNRTFGANQLFHIIVNNQKYSDSFEEVTSDYLRGAEEKRIGKLSFAELNNLILDESEGVVKELENCPSEIGYSFVHYISFLKNKWLKPFVSASMAPGEFTNQDGSRVLVPMLTMVDKLRYLQTEEVEAIEKEYDNGMSLIIVKPRGNAGARQLINFMTPDNLNHMMMNPIAFEKKSIALTIPKVRLVDQVDFFDVLPLKGELIDEDPAPLSLFRGITAFALDEGGEGNVREDVDMDAEKFVVNGPFAMVMVNTKEANIVYMSNVLKL